MLHNDDDLCFDYVIVVAATIVLERLQGPREKKIRLLFENLRGRSLSSFGKLRRFSFCYQEYNVLEGLNGAYELPNCIISD